MKLKKVFFIIFVLICFENFFINADEINTNTTEIETELNYPFNLNISISHFLRLYTKTSSLRYTELEFTGKLKPANILVDLNIKFVYLPYINFFAGTTIGTGWAYPKLNFYGIGENQNIGGSILIKPLYFSKVFLSAHLGLELYFNLKSKIKNEWAGLTLKTRQLVNYRALLPSKNTDFWFFDNDLGENRNGAVYKGSYSIEYTMPLYLNIIRLELLTYKKLYKSIPGTNNQAENLWIFDLKTAIFFKPSEKIKIKLESIWRTAPIYHSAPDETHFIHKVINSKKVMDMFFESVSASLIFKL